MNNMRFRWPFCSFGIALATLVCYAETTIDGDAALRVHSLPSPDSNCEYKGQKGVCVMQTQCKRPTGMKCKFAAIPIVCCLVEPENTTIRNPVFLKRVKHDINDGTLSGCGKRFPEEKKSQLSYQAPSMRSYQFGKRFPEEKKSQLSYQAPSMRSYQFGLFPGRKKREAANIGRHGQPQDKLYALVIGGKEPKAFSWPWMIGLFKKLAETRQYLCGASLISYTHVLTAAHCFMKEGNPIIPSRFVVTVGAHTTKDGKEFRVKQVVLHHAYKHGENYNDIALLKLATNVYGTDYIYYPICLPVANLEIVPYGNVTVTGWGKTMFDAPVSRVLQELTSPIIPLEKCRKQYMTNKPDLFPKGFPNEIICAGGIEDYKYICTGDSGGPLMLEVNDNTWVQVGIASLGCGGKDNPSIFTKVSSYIQWIYNTMYLMNS